MSGKTSPEEEQTLLAWFSDPDHKEEIMAFYKSRWEESSGKKLPPKLQGQMFCEIKKRIRQEEKTLEINLKSASNLNGNLNCSKELEHYAS